MKTRLLPLLVVATTILALTPPAAAQSLCTDEPPIGDRHVDVVYVPNRADSTVSVVDVTPGSACEFEVIQLIDFATTGFGNAAPTAIFIHPLGRRAFVVQSSHDALGVIDTRAGEVIKEIPTAVGSGALAGAMSPDGSRVYVSNLLLGTVSVVDTVNEVSIAEVPLGLGPDSIPIGLTVSPDGTELWATTSFPGALVVIDLVGDAHTIEQTIFLAPIPDPLFTPGIPPAAVDVAFDTTGPEPVANVVTLGRESAIIPFPPFFVSMPDALYRIPISYDAATDPPPAPVAYGTYASPFGPGGAEITVSTTGTTWISNAGVLDPTTNTPIPDASGAYTNYATLFAGGSASPVAVLTGTDTDPTDPSADNLSPVGIRRSPDGSAIYLVNFTSGTLAVFDAASESLQAVVPVGNGPVTPAGRTIPPRPTTPEFTVGPCGQTFDLVLGNVLAFDVEATTTSLFADTDELTLDAGGLPDPSVMTPLLPVFNPGGFPGATTVTSSFSWQPVLASEVGTYVVDFTAAGHFETTTCQVTINVVLPAPPVFTSPANGQLFQVETGEALGFDVAAMANPGAGNVVLDLRDGPASLPPGATMVPELPSDGASPSAASTFNWTPAVGDEGTYTIWYDATDAFGQVTELSVTIEVLEPSAQVPFAHFIVWKLKIDKRPHKGTFHYAGAFKLGDESDGIDPENEDVAIGFDDFELIIPGGSFSERGHNLYRVMGVFDGVRVFGWLKQFRGRHHDHSWWTFFFTGKDADLSNVTNPVDAKLRVGDDAGRRSKRAWIKG